jgi:hypothetical protein
MTPEPETNGAPTPGLEQGTEGDAVRALQSLLKSLKAYDGPEDGVFGPQTESAVRELQRKHGLPATGVADAQTEQVIAAAADADAAAAQNTTAPVDPRVGQLIVNETNKRVVITAPTGESFVLSPLERRTISTDDLKLFEEELDDLERQCIVAVPPPEISTRDAAIVGGGMWVIVAYIIAGFILGSRWFWIAGAVALLIGAMVAFGVSRSGGRAAARWSAQLAALLVVLIVGVVLPGVAIYFPGGVDDIVRDAYIDETIPKAGVDLTLLGRALQLLFMSAASLLPALLYFLFDRQQLRTLREQFERHMFRLDPSVDSLADVRAKYGTLLGETYGATTDRGRGRLLPGRRSPVLIATVVITFGWLVTLLNQDVKVINDRVGVLALFQPQRSALIFGFLGAYFFALQLIQRGYARGDLRPKTYTQITIRILLVTILAMVLQVMPGADDEPYILVLAFAAGIVPETALVGISEYLNSSRVGAVFGRGIAEPNPLTNVEGIDLYDRARLLDEGVSNVEGLAHHDLIELMLQTRIPAPRLVDWIDQAILYLHVGSSDCEGEESRDASMLRLRSFGIRTATDLEQAHFEAKNRGELPQFLQILPGSASSAPIPRISVILDTIKDEEWMANLRYWHNPEHLVEQTLVWPPAPAAPPSAPAPRRTRRASRARTR